MNNAIPNHESVGFNIVTDFKSALDNLKEEYEHNQQMDQQIELMGKYILDQLDMELDMKPNTELDMKPNTEPNMEPNEELDTELNQLQYVELDENYKLDASDENSVVIERNVQSIRIKNMLSHNTIDRILSPLNYPSSFKGDEKEYNNNINDAEDDINNNINNNYELCAYGIIGVFTVVGIIYAFSRKK